MTTTLSGPDCNISVVSTSLSAQRKHNKLWYSTPAPHTSHKRMKVVSLGSVPLSSSLQPFRETGHGLKEFSVDALHPGNVGAVGEFHGAVSQHLRDSFRQKGWEAAALESIVKSVGATDISDLALGVNALAKVETPIGGFDRRGNARLDIAIETYFKPEIALFRVARMLKNVFCSHSHAIPAVPSSEGRREETMMNLARHVIVHTPRRSTSRFLHRGRCQIPQARDFAALVRQFQRSHNSRAKLPGAQRTKKNIRTPLCSECVVWQIGHVARIPAVAI